MEPKASVQLGMMSVSLVVSFSLVSSLGTSPKKESKSANGLSKKSMSCFVLSCLVLSCSKLEGREREDRGVLMWSSINLDLIVM